MLKWMLAAIAATIVGVSHAQIATPNPVVMDPLCDMYRGTSIVQRDVPNTPAGIAAAWAQLVTARGTTSGSYACRASTPVSGTIGAPPPPPTCTTPQPAAENRTVQCPAPTTGQWTQTRTYAAAPAPTCWAASAWAPDAAPAGACMTPPPPPTGSAIYVSDVACSASNPGTEAAPKCLSSVNLNTLPAGSTVLLRRGGTFGSLGRLDNRNVTSAAPLTIADYGTGALPVIRVTAGTAISFGMYGDTTPDGGYVIRNLKIDGAGSAQWGAFVQGATRDVTFDGVEFTGFDIGIHMQQAGSAANERVTIRNSFIHHNSEHGVLGDSNGLVFEGNRVEDNNPSGGGREHGAYLGGHSTGMIVRNNQFRRNSAPGGVCDGGNLTIHGQHERVEITGNLVEQASATNTCFGISLTAGYNEPEWFRNATISGNTVVNVGACAICVSSAPGVLIENNKVYNSMTSWHIGVLIPAIQPGAGDAVDSGAVIRNNLICHTGPNADSAAVRAPSAASITDNVYQTGAAASTGACAR